MDWQFLLKSSAALLLAAFFIDLVVGDPRWLPHPVVLMGKVISHGERWLRSGNVRRDFLAGHSPDFVHYHRKLISCWSKLTQRVSTRCNWFFFVKKEDTHPRLQLFRRARRRVFPHRRETTKRQFPAAGGVQGMDRVIKRIVP